jgi:hypothetical protein
MQGWFDFQAVPEVGGKEDEADTWTIGFDYHFHYEKPIECAMYYPLMVHNPMRSVATDSADSSVNGSK